MGLTVKTDDKGVMVFANERETENGKYINYSVGVSSKNQNGEWVNGYVPVRFKKGVTVANKAKIKINNAFYTVMKNGDKTYVSLMITDFDDLSEGTNSNDGFIDMSNIKDEDLPFAD